MTVAHGRCGDGRGTSCTTLDGYVWNRRLRRAASCLRHRRRCAAPDGVPRIRLLGRRPARRPRRADGASPGGAAGQPRGRSGRQPTPPAWPAAPASDTPAGPPTAGPPTATPTRTATPAARSRSSTTASSRTSPRCAPNWKPPAWSSPATPTPRSPCTWCPGSTTTAPPQVISSASVLAVLPRLEGHFTLVFANADDPGTIVAARRSTPLVLGRR